MSLLSTHVATLPQIYQQRYRTQWTGWCNQLLEELSGRGFMPLLRKEVGVVVENDFWIDKPSDLVSLEEIFNPENIKLRYRVKQVNDRFRLLDVSMDAEESPATPTAFSNFTTTGLDVDLTDKDEDEFENYLLVITEGTYAGKSYVLSGNDETDGGVTTLHFLHDLATALDDTKVTAGYITGPDYYLMMRYRAHYEKLSSTADEVPIKDEFEDRIVPAWLRFKAEQHASSVSNETVYWERQVEKLLFAMEGEQNGKTIRPARGRRLIGFERACTRRTKEHPDYSDFT